jgi:magnesium transporter
MQLKMIRFGPNGSSPRSGPVELDSIPQELGEGECLWLDACGSDPAVLDQLARTFQLEPGTFSDLTDQPDRARIDYFGDYVQLYLHGLIAERGHADVRPRALLVICRHQTLLTLHPEPHDSTRFLFDAAQRAAPAISRKGISHLLFLLVDRIVDNSMLLAKDYERQLNELEDRSLSQACGEDLLEDLAVVRDRVLQLWRTLVSNRELMIELCEEEFDFLHPESARQLEQVRDHLTSTLEIAEILRGMVNDVRENYRTTLSLRSAQAMQQLTVFAGLMMPLTLIVGIYGMNVPLWPDPARPSTFWLIMGFMGVVAAGLLYYFRRQRWT